MPRLETLREVWLYVRERKAYWLAPILIVLLIFGLLLIFAQSSAVTPFVYTLF